MKCVHGVVANMKMDLAESNIEYFVNDKSIGIIFKYIPVSIDIKYGLVIDMGHDGETQQLKTLNVVIKIFHPLCERYGSNVGS